MRFFVVITCVALMLLGCVLLGCEDHGKLHGVMLRDEEGNRYFLDGRNTGPDLYHVVPMKPSPEPEK